MGLRCLIGHDYRDRQTEGNREERGDEVVVTVQEFRECARCGHRRILSENKEIKPRISSSSEHNGDADVYQTSDSGGVGGHEFEEVSASEDDGIILEDEPSPDREPGEWPPTPNETDDEDAAIEPKAWPSQSGEDEGFSAEPTDGRPIDDVEFSRGGLTPEPKPTDPTSEVIVDDSIESKATATRHTAGQNQEMSVTDSTREKPSPTPTNQQRRDRLNTVFVCPDCGHEVPGMGSSLRAGDICPECHNGYMNERDR